jgi:long-subunit acyl-CoA synthetase (AMP-forming)/alkylation response protein AidB-like acyl-CoA dehydrogenase
VTTRTESARGGVDPSGQARDTTLLDLLVARLGDAATRPALATQPSADDATTTWTWLEAAAAAVDLAVALEATGLRRGDRVVHVGTHSVDWVVVDLACLLAGVVHVALHADAPRSELLDQIAWLAPAGVVLSGEAGPFPSGDAARLLGGRSVPRRVIDRRRPAPRRGQRLPPPSAGLCSEAWRSRAADPEALEREVARRAAAIDPDAPARIFFSSGTTGRPRGYVHSQRSLATNALAAAAIFLDESFDVRLSWLPMSHALACTGDLSTALVRGGCLNVVPDRRRLLDACRFLPPTVILGVPAFYERLERGVRSGAIPDLAAVLGGRVRVCISGGAALRERTQALFAARGVPLVEGYGLAEAGPVVALDNPRGYRPGWVGKPLAGIDVRLDSVGQLLVRTPSRALGQVLPPDAQPAVDDHHGDPADGWIATGDTAEIAADGRIRITGRVVDTIVLSTGTKLPPAEVERVLADDAIVAQVCVCGDRLPVPVALIVPEPAVVRATLRSLGIRVASRRAALRHPRLLRWLARRLARRQASLPRSWRVRRIVLINRPFDIDRGEMTHSMKLKRPSIANHFAATLDAASAPSPPPGVADVPRGDALPSPPSVPSPHATAGIAAALWGLPRGDDGGFANAAALAAQPFPDEIAGVLEEAQRRLGALRAEGLLYAPMPTTELPPAPLDDAPPRPEGLFTAVAEAAVGETGLWGVHVPVAHGGCGGTVVDLVKSVTKIAGVVPSAAGMLAVHSAIGAVSALVAFGTPSQQARHLPGLAAGRPLSVFGATEPEVGCDLGAVRTTLARRDGRLVIDGTKMFITNATYGRLVKLLVVADGKPAVVLARLPDRDTPSFRLLSYALHPLRHTANHALEFRGFTVDEQDVIKGPGGDAMAVVWHGLNRGRSTLAAQAAGTLGLLRAHAREHALRRASWGQPIASRQLVQGRLARIAAGSLACEALSTWAAATIDTSGGTGGELEAITAKVVASQTVREGAIDALGIHGGRAFLVGHPLGDSFHDHLAVGVYEGESDLLGLALFKGLSKRHPLAERLRQGSRFGAAVGWLGWRVARLAGAGHDAGILDRRLREHAAAARKVLAASAVAIDRAIRRHGRGLAERQLEVGSLSAVVRDAASALAVAHHADVSCDDSVTATADVWCRMALSRASGRRLTPADHAAIGALGRRVVEG